MGNLRGESARLTGRVCGAARWKASSLVTAAAVQVVHMRRNRLYGLTGASAASAAPCANIQRYTERKRPRRQLPQDFQVQVNDCHTKSSFSNPK